MGKGTLHLHYQQGQSENPSLPLSISEGKAVSVPQFFYESPVSQTGSLWALGSKGVELRPR